MLAPCSCVGGFKKRRILVVATIVAWNGIASNGAALPVRPSTSGVRLRQGIDPPPHAQGVQVWPVSQLTGRIFSWTTTQETYVFAFGSGGASIRSPIRFGDPVVSRV